MGPFGMLGSRPASFTTGGWSARATFGTASSPMQSPTAFWPGTSSVRDNGSIGCKSFLCDRAERRAACAFSQYPLMIQLNGAGKRFGPRFLFEDLNWLITPKERVGIVGANGTGKSTLLKVLGAIESLDYGSVNAAKAVRAGYLPQDGIHLTGRTVFAECMSVFEALRALEQEQKDLAHRMAELDHESPEYRQIAERYHEIQDEFTARDGYNVESRVGSVLAGLGFPRTDWERR